MDKFLSLLPKWARNKAKDNPTIILVGNELVAVKNPRENWKLKKVRCNQCGECCMDIPANLLPFGTNESPSGKCNMLEKEGEKWLCRAGHMKPFSCLFDPADTDCCIRYF